MNLEPVIQDFPFWKKVNAFLNDSLNHVPGPEEANVYTSTLCTQIEK